MKENVLQYLLDLKCVLLDEADPDGADLLDEVMAIVQEHEEP